MKRSRKSSISSKVTHFGSDLLTKAIATSEGSLSEKPAIELKRRIESRVVLHPKSSSEMKLVNSFKECKHDIKEIKFSTLFYCVSFKNSPLLRLHFAKRSPGVVDYKSDILAIEVLGEHILSLHADKTLRVMDSSTGDITTTKIPPIAKTESLIQLVATRKYVAIIGINYLHTIERHDKVSFLVNTFQSTKLSMQPKASLTSAAGELICIGSTSGFSLHNMKTSVKLQEVKLGHYENFIRVAFCGMCVVGSTGHGLKLWNFSTADIGQKGDKPISDRNIDDDHYLMLDEESGTLITALHIDESFLLTGDENGKITLRHGSNGESYHALNGKETYTKDTDIGIRKSLAQLDLAQSILKLYRVGSCVIAGHKEGFISIWSINKRDKRTPLLSHKVGQPVKSFIVCENLLTALAFEPVERNVKLLTWTIEMPTFFKENPLTGKKGSNAVTKTTYQEYVETFKNPVHWAETEIQKNVFTVLVFVRSGDDQFCSRFLTRWNAMSQYIDEIGAKIFAISAERPEKVKAWKQELFFPGISDRKNNLARFFNVHLTKKKGFEFKMPESAVIVLTNKRDIIFDWRNKPVLRNLMGGKERPDPYDIMLVIFDYVLNLEAGNTTCLDAKVKVHFGCPLTKVGWNSWDLAKWKTRIEAEKQAKNNRVESGKQKDSTSEMVTKASIKVSVCL